jgi:hypothetical protein
MRDLGKTDGREGASMLEMENIRKLLVLIHKLFTRPLIIRPERVEGKIEGRNRQGK